jgi:uncharacterized protein (UPF0548 family)
MTIKTEHAEVELDIDLRCAKCDAELDGEFNETRIYNHFDRRLDIGPCEKCLDRAKDEAREEAKAEAGSGI